MNKVLGMHKIELKPGCSAQEFEAFMIRDVLPVYRKVPGQNVQLLKGDRGERAGKYMLLIELDSAQRRDEIYPSEGVIADDVQELVGNVDPLWQTIYTFVEEYPDSKYTDDLTVSD